jgi:carboxyl-terminal processing protease
MRRIIFLFVFVILSASTPWADETSALKDISSLAAPQAAVPLNQDFKGYVKFLQEVFMTMAKNYYYPVSVDSFKKFLVIFQKKIYPQLKMTHKTDDYIRWRSAAYMVDYLKSPEDIFSAFIPPKPAKKFEQTALGKKQDLGVEGHLIKEGYELTMVEPRSDAFEKGLREKDIIKELNNTQVAQLTEEEISGILNLQVGEKATVKYFDIADKMEKTIELISKEYFKQTVFMVPVSVPGVFCLRIEKFNQSTSEDMTKYMEEILKTPDSSLIIDLRGNPGGPPLAAREISAFFLPPNEEFAYFQMKNRPKASLSVPEIPEKYRFKGDVVILVDKKSGSASELFSGILQDRGRATLMGTNTAGQVFLKSMFPFEDESMLLLVTARGHFPDGKVFSFTGLEPNAKMEEPDVDLVKYAADYLTSHKRKK